MGGFQLNGCGAKDYFKKVKYLGDQICPNCKKLAPIYLEKGSFKVSVFWVPTVTLKERYAIMCEKCKQGKWIEDAEAYKILSGGNSADALNDAAQSLPVSALPKCPKCGAEMDGIFCGSCGAKMESAKAEVPKNICAVCGAEVDGAFCGSCGAKMEGAKTETPKKICAVCAAEVEGAFCGNCGTWFSESADSQKAPAETNGGSGDSFDEIQNTVTWMRETGKSVNEAQTPQMWECSLCGTSNLQSAENCSLCGCAKDKK